MIDDTGLQMTNYSFNHSHQAEMSLIYFSEEPIVWAKWNKNSSCVTKGEIDESHDKERMSVTTNRISFPNVRQQTLYLIYYFIYLILPYVV